MSEIAELKEELAKVRAELHTHKALLLTILRDLPPQKDKFLLRIGASVNDLNRPDIQELGTLIQFLRLLNNRK
ncbi:hypothetical protein ACRRCN_003274 [Escherichia coli]|uniref:hypothetical protein n=1 Tax=Escherichia coli TaxID=562 RepID=UPI0015C582FF|nr:hypothetical protein [Escherichia coli]EIH0338674.1 hypothetical protein [Escherichia coli O22]EEU9148129.1 hypothetical protein [Escherichia coli]EFH3105929.1 hypothetical protein [Escherichia coli]EFL9682136.1 hypothetical protein [Escherichia coli]EHK7425881.1 hypothetical protein [Escherichia coli]